MKRAGFKTFVYSFIFSLFAIFSTNSVYLHFFKTPKNNNLDLKIPNKNITLFLRNDASQAKNILSTPSKKIVLAHLPDIHKESDDINIQDKIPLNETVELNTNPSSATLLAETDIIPIQSFSGSNNQHPKKQKDVQPLEKPKITIDFDNIIKSPPPVDVSELRHYASIQDTVPQKEEIMTDDSKENNILLDTPPIKAPKTAFSSNDEENTPPPVKVASLEEKAAPLIPIEKNKGVIRVGNKEIEIAQKAPANQLALKAENIPIKSMLEKETSSEKNKKKNLSSSEWVQMADKQPKDNVWAVARGAKHPKNGMVLESDSYNKTPQEIQKIFESPANEAKDASNIELASTTVKNLLIPIPEEILKDENLTPQLASSPQEKTTEEELSSKEKEEESAAQEINEPQTPPPAKNEGSLLSSISSIFNSKKNDLPQIGSSVETGKDEDSLFSAFRRKKIKTANRQILPTEIRLSFQPNRAEISGQTLKWIRAFANKTIEEPSTGLEIRIDGTSSPFLQQRRLNLLQNILAGEGVDYAKINTVFTSREPNSFIIRTVRINKDTTNRGMKINNKDTYKPW